MKRILSLLFLLLLLLLGFMTYNSMQFSSKQISRESIPALAVDEATIDRFSKHCKQTISPEQPEDFDSLAFFQFNDYLKAPTPSPIHFCWKSDLDNSVICINGKGVILI